MTEKENKLLFVFDERLHDLIKLCDRRKARIAELETYLSERDEYIRQAKQTIATLTAKYEDLLVVKRLAEADVTVVDGDEAGNCNGNGESEFQKIRRRVNKLVREVDRCITLLNE
ncbi:MAG: hypothetical protein LBR84_07790 [Tannerella sp.]|jgi:phage shock protein A|nr:hypothetical protein [Tannerella sp.]